MLRRRFFLFLAAVLLCLLSACSWFGGDPAPEAKGPEQGVTDITDGNEIARLNFRVARTYAADGRYELAREHYLLALSTAKTPGLRGELARELDGVDKMIKSLR